jgi:hypothetical protein
VLVLGVTLLEPSHVGVTPLAFLALGSAGATAAEEPGRARALTAVSVIAGLVLSGTLVVGLDRLHAADLAGDPSAAASAARMLPPWGQTDAVTGTLVAFRAIRDRSAEEMASAERWWTAAAQRDSANPARWEDLASALAKSGDPLDAATAYRRALADNPWSLRALRGIVALAPAGVVTPAEVSAAHQKLRDLNASA